MYNVKYEDRGLMLKSVIMMLQGCIWLTEEGIERVCVCVSAGWWWWYDGKCRHMDDCRDYSAVIPWWGSSLYNVSAAPDTHNHTPTHTDSSKTTFKLTDKMSEFIFCPDNRTEHLLIAFPGIIMNAMNLIHDLWPLEAVEEGAKIPACYESKYVLFIIFH